eukprot:COSAG01_NODE_12228_length_1777_cov_1.592968_2_plen_69_part_00
MIASEVVLPSRTLRHNVSHPPHRAHPLEPSGRPLTTKLEDAGPRQLQAVLDPTALESQQQRLPSTLPA